jgi:hypothetical protein
MGSPICAWCSYTPLVFKLRSKYVLCNTVIHKRIYERVIFLEMSFAETAHG